MFTCVFTCNEMTGIKIDNLFKTYSDLPLGIDQTDRLKISMVAVTLVLNVWMVKWLSRLRARFAFG